MNISQVVSNLINNEQGQEVGLAGFTAYIYQDKKVSRSANVTKIPLENGSIISDHVSLSPDQLSIGGIVSDNYWQDSRMGGLETQATAFLGSISPYLANKSAHMLSKIHLLDGMNNRASSVLDSSTNIYNRFMGKPTANNGLMQQFIDTFDAFYKQRKLLSIDMGYQVYENMVIDKFETSQDNQVDAIVFTMSLTQVSFVTFESVEVNKVGGTKKSKSAKIQTTHKIKKGIQSGKKIDFNESAFHNMKDKGINGIKNFLSEYYD